MAADQLVPDTPIDGRTARAVRTRERIVDACIALCESGDLRPTAPRIAEEAEVSVRSVFQHFDDLETLFAMVAERAVSRVSQLIVPIDPNLPFPARLDRLIGQRQKLLEAITPIRRAAAVHAPFSREITKRLEFGHEFLRGEIALVFAHELDLVDATERELLLDIVDTALSWGCWENLRTLNGRSAEESSLAVSRMVALALGGAAK